MTLLAFVYSGVSIDTPAASTTTFNLVTNPGGAPIPYLQRDHIKVYSTVDNGETLALLARPSEWDFNTEGTQVILATPADGATSYTIRRETPLTSLYVTFSSGRLSPEQLNQSAQFALFVLQEYLDGAGGGTVVDLLALTSRVSTNEGDISDLEDADATLAAADAALASDITALESQDDSLAADIAALGAEDASLAADIAALEAALEAEDVALAADIAALEGRADVLEARPGRNLLINAVTMINQRGYVSGAATAAANQYTIDRWRVAVSGQALSWSFVDGLPTFTAPAGGVEQVVEGLSILGGTYTLGWTGTATALVNSTAVANGGQVTLPAGTNAVVRFSGGTFRLPQLESGSVATAFDVRAIGTELALCQRYYEKGQVDFRGVGNINLAGTVAYKATRGLCRQGLR